MSLVITNNTIDKYFGFLSRLDIISQKIRYIHQNPFEEGLGSICT